MCLGEVMLLVFDPTGLAWVDLSYRQPASTGFALPAAGFILRRPANCTLLREAAR